MRGREDKNYKVKQKKILILAITILFIIGTILIGGSISGLAKTNGYKESTYKYYTSIMIENGDSLWSIASEFMSEEYKNIEAYIMEVKRLNHLNSDNIYAGEYLTIPYYSSDLL